MNIFDGKFRNQPCGCHSGKKFKKCCLPKVQGYINVDNLWIKGKNEANLREVKIVDN